MPDRDPGYGSGGLWFSNKHVYFHEMFFVKRGEWIQLRSRRRKQAGVHARRLPSMAAAEKKRLCCGIGRLKYCKGGGRVDHGKTDVALDEMPR